MLHFTCDLCGCELSDPRYLVKIEAFAATDTDALTEEDLDADHMQEISELLDGLKDVDPQDLEDDSYRAFRFDLCPACYKKFLRDPLGREALSRLNFSEN